MLQFIEVHHAATCQLPIHLRHAFLLIWQTPKNFHHHAKMAVFVNPYCPALFANVKQDFLGNVVKNVQNSFFFLNLKF